MNAVLADFFAYARERYSIYLKRQAGEPAPWTDRPILRQFRFCNVFREDDVVTRWVQENIREPFAESPYLWLMLALARYVNHVPTLEELLSEEAWPGLEETLGEFDPSWVTPVLEARAESGEKVYTSAYMIRAESDPKKPWYSWSKHRYIAEIVFGRLWDDRNVGPWLFLSDFPAHGQPSLEEVWGYFQQPRYVGWGPFMAYEVVTDLRHTRYLRNAPDINTWANAGPGAIRGLNRIQGRYLKTQPPAEITLVEMREILEASRLPENWPAAWPAWELREVEHTLCEFDKYERVRLGEGRPRQLFRGEGRKS